MSGQLVDKVLLKVAVVSTAISMERVIVYRQDSDRMPTGSAGAKGRHLDGCALNVESIAGMEGAPCN